MCAPSACLPCYSSLLHQFTHFQWEKVGFGQPSLIKHQFKENALLPQFYSKTQVNVLAFGSLADNTRFCSLYFLCSSPLSNFIKFPGAAQGISCAEIQIHADTEFPSWKETLFACDTDITFLQDILPVWRNINQDPHKPCESIPAHNLACLKVWVIHPNHSWLHKSLFFPRSIIYSSASRIAVLSRYKHPSYWSSSFQPVSPVSRASVGSWVCGKVIPTPRRAAPSILPWIYTSNKQCIIVCDTHSHGIV